ncbi:MAG: hypothetical protein RL722_403 [Pseudomonadota bacterium]|jgi:cytochrome P450
MKTALWSTRTPRLFTADKQPDFGPKFGVGTPLYEHHTTSLVFNDPPRHTRVRRLIAEALTPKAIVGMDPGLIALADRLMDAMAAKATRSEMEDLVARRRAEPGDPERDVLTRGAVEEILRYERSNQLGNRMSAEATKIAGMAIAADTSISITIAIGAANRDPARFSDP